jgi:hypothetical protein
MPASPVPPTPPSDEERPATVLETDEDILKALKRANPIGPIVSQFIDDAAIWRLHQSQQNHIGY